MTESADLGVRLAAIRQRLYEDGPHEGECISCGALKSLDRHGPTCAVAPLLDLCTALLASRQQRIALMQQWRTAIQESERETAMGLHTQAGRDSQRGRRLALAECIDELDAIEQALPSAPQQDDEEFARGSTMEIGVGQELPQGNAGDSSPNTLGVPLHLRREPTPRDFADPRFAVIWELIKRVDVDFRNGLFSGATGNDVCAVLDALDAASGPPLDSPPRRAHEWFRDELEKAKANANHYATNQAPGAAKECQYWRGRWSALLDAQAQLAGEAPEASTPATPLTALIAEVRDSYSSDRRRLLSALVLADELDAILQADAGVRPAPSEQALADRTQVANSLPSHVTIPARYDLQGAVKYATGVLENHYAVASDYHKPFIRQHIEALKGAALPAPAPREDKELAPDGAGVSRQSAYDAERTLGANNTGAAPAPLGPQEPDELMSDGEVRRRLKAKRIADTETPG